MTAKERRTPPWTEAHNTIVLEQNTAAGIENEYLRSIEISVAGVLKMNNKKY